MSLAAKLNQMKAELSESQRASEEKERQEALQLIKQKIVDLEKKKSALDLLYNSLQPQADKQAGGLKIPEYSEQVKAKVGKQESKLDRLVNENQEVLAQAGVKDRQDLLDHPEFSTEEEVVSYRDSLAQAEELSMSDEALRKRLTDLGVEVAADGKISYEDATQALAEKIGAIEKEIVQEKIKVPEYRQEVVDSLSSKINLKDMFSLVYEEGKDESRLELGGPGRGKALLVYDEKKQQADLDRHASSKWLDDIYGVNWDQELSSLKAEYGGELVNEALHQAWRKKISEQIIDSNAKKGGDVRYIKKILEEDLAHRSAAEDKISKLKGVSLELQDLIIAKASELAQTKSSDKKVDLSSLNIFHVKDNDDLLKVIASDNSFPPRYSYRALDSLADKKLNVAQDYLEKIRAVQNLDEFKILVGGQQVDELFRSTVAEDSASFKWSGEPTKYFQATMSRIQDFVKQKDDVSQVLRKIDLQIAKEENITSAMAGKMDLAIDIKDTQAEYLRKYRQAKENLALSRSFENVKDFEDMERSLLENKRDAILLIQELQTRERLLRDICSKRNLEVGQVIVSDNWRLGEGITLFSHALNAERDKSIESRQKMADEISDMEKQDKDIELEIDKLGKKPKLFSGGWEAKHKDLQARKDEIRQKIETTRYQIDDLNKKLRAKYEEEQNLVVKVRNPDIKQILFKKYDEVFDGELSEVIKSLSERLTKECVDKTSVPEDLKQLASQYKKLVEALYK